MLVGSQSFWEGIDVPGDALQCVLIDKLPFPPPNDPLVEARVKRLESEGRNPFADYFVAEAAVSLKQGAGRLIRSETDRGLLVVCDPRMAGMNYGKRLRMALPPMTMLATEAEALEWLETLPSAVAAVLTASAPASYEASRHAWRHQTCHHGFFARRADAVGVSVVSGKFWRSTRSASSRSFGQAEPVVALDHHDEQRFLGRRRLLEVGDRLLGAVGRRDVSAAPIVVARDVDFVRCQRADDVVHAQPRVVGVQRIRELIDQLLERRTNRARPAGRARTDPGRRGCRTARGCH